METHTQLRARYVATKESSHISLHFQWGRLLLLLGLILVLSGAGFRAQAAGPYSATQLPTQITANSASLNGMASPNGDVSVAWFEWGTNSSYGQTTGAVDAGAGNGVASVTAGLSGLAGHASYYFRLVVSNATGVAFGGQQQFTTGGKILGWGDNSSGQTISPGVLRRVVAISAGIAHSLALQTDGRVMAWGTNSWQQTSVPVSATNVVAIACGYYHCLALKSDGTLVAWGDYRDGQLLVTGFSNIVAIAAGSSHSVALKNDGTVLVAGSPTARSIPGGLSNVVAIAAGGGHTLALKNDGTLVGWGDNVFGQGQPLPGLSNVVAIATGPFHSLAIKSDGTVIAWGQNFAGRTNVPAGLNDAVAVVAGVNHSVVLRANGTAVAWGDNTSGQTNVPAGSNNLLAVAAGVNHSFSLANGGEPLAMTAAATAVRSASGTLNGMVFQDEPSALAWFEWGSTRSLGQVAGPVPIIATTNFVSRVSVGISGLTFGQTCFYRLAVSNVFGVTYGAIQQFTTGGKLLAWGYNTSGQTNIPPGLTNAVAIDGGLDYSLALRNDGKILAWGDNGLHQTSVPVSLSNAVAIAGGTWHSVALRSDGKVVAWGDNSSGQTNVPIALTNGVAVACGQAYTLALKPDGAVAVWGDNSYGQTSFPIGLGGIAAIAGGQRHMVALKLDGTVLAWGNNDAGQASVPGSLNGVVAIAAGTSHSAALRSDGTVVTWGSFSFKPPTGLSNVVAIASGDDFILALKEDGSLVTWGFNSHGGGNVLAGLSNMVSAGAGAWHALAIGPNLPPVADAQTVAGFPNRDETLMLTGSDPNGDLVNLRIVSLPAAGTLYQYVAGSRGGVVLAADTPVSDPGGRLIFAPLSNEAGSPYASFSFVANDGTADSTPAAVNLSVVLPVAPQFLNADRSTDGAFQFNFTGDSNAAYRVWASTNLLDWDLLGTANMTSPGVFQLSDPSATNWPHRFYRAGAP